MKFTPELEFPGGRVKPLHYDDIDALYELYQHPEIPGQRPLQDKEHLNRMVDYSVQMAATQRGIMWAIEINGEIKGMVSGFDWQPSQLRIMMRVDGLPTLTIREREKALSVCIDFLVNKYHIRNFGYQWIAGQNEDITAMLIGMGFEHTATLRDAWRIGERTFANVAQYHFISSKDKPVPKRLGDGHDDDYSPGQNLNGTSVKGGE